MARLSLRRQRGEFHLPQKPQRGRYRCHRFPQNSGQPDLSIPRSGGQRVRCRVHSLAYGFCRACAHERRAVIGYGATLHLSLLLGLCTPGLGFVQRAEHFREPSDDRRVRVWGHGHPGRPGAGLDYPRTRARPPAQNHSLPGKSQPLQRGLPPLDGRHHR